MVQYFTASFYAPFLVSAAASAVHGTFELAVINDEPFGAGVSGHVELTMRSWADGPLNTWTVPFEAPPGSVVKLLPNTSFTDLLSKGGCPDGEATRCVLTLRALDG